MSTPFVYLDLAAAQQDLILFSRMHSNLDRALYLCQQAQQWQILTVPWGQPLAIGLNGQCYCPI